MAKPSKKRRQPKLRASLRAVKRSAADLSASASNEPELRLFRIPGLPEIRKGEDLAEVIAAAARKSRLQFEDGDVLVVAQKIVSKAEGRVVSLNSSKKTAYPAYGEHKKPKLEEGLRTVKGD